MAGLFVLRRPDTERACGRLGFSGSGVYIVAARRRWTLLSQKRGEHCPAIIVLAGYCIFPVAQSLSGRSAERNQLKSAKPKYAARIGEHAPRVFPPAPRRCGMGLRQKMSDLARPTAPKVVGGGHRPRHAGRVRPNLARESQDLSFRFILDSFHGYFFWGSLFSSRSSVRLAVFSPFTGCGESPRKCTQHHAGSVAVRLPSSRLDATRWRLVGRRRGKSIPCSSGLRLGQWFTGQGRRNRNGTLPARAGTTSVRSFDWEASAGEASKPPHSVSPMFPKVADSGRRSARVRLPSRRDEQARRPGQPKSNLCIRFTGSTEKR